MAKLITHHDPFHIHKTLGVLVLLNYLGRLCLLLFTGKSHMAIEDVESGACSYNRFLFDCATVTMTAVLSWSSLLLPLPKVRNFSSPMIWPEFRFHSITFATRHIIGTLMSMLRLWPTNLYLNYLSKLALVLGTCYTADYFTYHYGDREKRTTNAMPYPPTFTNKMQKGNKKNYANAQFLAALCTIGEDPDFAFWPVTAIQTAPLLMTLVRKGKVNALFLHRVYTLSLTVPMVWYLAGKYFHGHYDMLMQTYCVCSIFTIPYEMRVKYHCSKFLTWTVGVALLNCALVGAPIYQRLEQFCSYQLGVAFCVVSAAWVTWSKMRYFIPLFDLTYHTAPRAFEEMIVDFLNWNFKLNIKFEDKTWERH